MNEKEIIKKSKTKSTTKFRNDVYDEDHYAFMLEEALLVC